MRVPPAKGAEMNLTFGALALTFSSQFSSILILLMMQRLLGGIMYSELCSTMSYITGMNYTLYSQCF